MQNKETENKKAVYIRKDGWVFTEDGMKKLTEGGYKGHERYMQSLERQIGKWHRIARNIDRDAADILKSVKGVAARAVFVSNAIVKEAERRARKGVK